MREVLSWVRAIPRALLVEQEQLSYSIAYGLALISPLAWGVFCFRRPAALLIALCFLAGIICLLALRLAALTVGLPAWVGVKANQPLISSLLVACFLPSTAPAWLGVAMVVLLVVLDTILWPRLNSVMLHPALPVLGILYLVQRQLGIGFVNPFDLRPLDDPLSLWYRLHIVIDPVKLYVGNVPGPLGATSMGALLLGLAYLWYTRKISLGLLAGFLVGIAAASVALHYDVAFQLSSGPALFVAGYLAADRRRISLDERGALILGVAAGAATVALRRYGQNEQAPWEALLAVGTLATLGLWGAGLVARRPAGAPATAMMRTLAVRSNSRGPQERAAPTPALTSLRAQPVGVASTSSMPVRSHAVPQRFTFDDSANPDEIVRQMRRAASQRSIAAQSGPWAIWVLALLVLNPAGLWMTWTTVPLGRVGKIAVTVASVLWYGALVALVLALRHRL